MILQGRPQAHERVLGGAEDGRMVAAHLAVGRGESARIVLAEEYHSLFVAKPQFFAQLMAAAAKGWLVVFLRLAIKVKTSDAFKGRRIVGRLWNFLGHPMGAQIRKRLNAAALDHERFRQQSTLQRLHRPAALLTQILRDNGQRTGGVPSQHITGIKGLEQRRHDMPADKQTRNGIRRTISPLAAKAIRLEQLPILRRQCPALRPHMRELTRIIAQQEWDVNNGKRQWHIGYGSAQQNQSYIGHSQKTRELSPQPAGGLVHRHKIDEQADIWLHKSDAVSYTHLTLPTIY